MSRLLVVAARFVRELGAIATFGFDAGRLLLREGVAPRAVVHQMYEVGVRSLATTLAISVFVGGIMAIQIYLQLRDFGAASFLGGLATSVTVRNVGPVLIGFLLSGKVGAFTSAELGTMQITDQINAIRCLGLNPLRYLVLPRMVAVVLSSFALLVIGLFLTVVGGLLVSEFVLGVNGLNYLANIPALVSGKSLATGLVKSFVFGAIIALVSCYHGYHVQGGAEAVGRAVRRSAVQTLVAMIVVDYFLSVGVEWL